VLRARLRLGLGDVSGALDDTERALEFGRAVRDPQVLQPTLLGHARALLAAGRRDDAERAVDELMRAKPRIGDWWLRELPLLLVGLGRTADFTEASTDALPTPWSRAGTAIAFGRFDDAARFYSQIGARADEAAVRMAAAEAAASEGRREEAARQLALALGFYRRAGATEYVRRGESLLASSA